MNKKTKETASPAQCAGPNMAKEYRKELRELQARKRKVDRLQRQNAMATKRAVAREEMRAVKEIRALKSAAAKLDNGLLKELAALNKREAILMGRLS